MERKPVIVIKLPCTYSRGALEHLIKIIKEGDISDDYHFLFMETESNEPSAEALYFNGTEEGLDSLQEKLLNQIKKTK